MLAEGRRLSRICSTPSVGADLRVGDGEEPPLARHALEVDGATFAELDPEPATRSLTVLETSTSPGSASFATRAPMCTAIPPTFLFITSHSPVWSPARTSSPSSPTLSAIADAQRIARAGPSNDVKKPSPAVRAPGRENGRVGVG